ncbi:hypothetical protein VR7878_03024 [Vibrio ruber DSM 16370]|uniref:Phage tail sheath protein n=1 Tax=Vibrio ruber (strain DSM 16370 / JCM 11486 / BCRC 17186 / CECT 7878 / LMG 23124 / VR1) TaxID=1123498 RepID=A0A1R4LQX4_VIBR1|nr:DUF2586 domain-containing protein [Vibrio ruber]SJN58757.1 hypothetical protein VR7878_03024 [Vibrio ruber DSM 16370]
MAWPSVIINIKNMMKGPIAGVEYHFLFVGYGTVSGAERELTVVDASTDLKEALSSAGDSLLTTVMAAQLNGGSEWTAGVMVLDQADDWKDAVRKANETASFEAFVLDFPAADKTLLEDAIAMRTELKNALGRETFAVCCLPEIDNTDATNGETWEAWLAKSVAIVDGVASQYITVVPSVHADGSTLGKYCGRLANQVDASIADSPARIKTGSVVGSTDFLTDKDGKALALSVLKTLESNRISCPMWYPDYDGQYWTTGRTLDVEGGDFQDIRHIRVAMKAARKVRIRAIARIADRTFNSTPQSEAQAKLFMTQDLREMALTGNPGEIYPPEDDDIQIKWVNSTEVEIYMAVQPYECPVKITVAIYISQGDKA